jgi:uncharacterized protein (TIGR02217 family)
VAFDDIVLELSVDHFTSTMEKLTQITTTQSGAETRVSWWEDPKVRFNASASIRTLQDLIYVREFHLLRDGMARGFLVKDLVDYQQSRDGSIVEIGIGDGTEHRYQIVKVYSDAKNEYTRNIYKPIQGTLHVYFNVTEKTEGVDWTCNYTTGVITATVPNDVAISTYCEFYIPVRFDTDKIPVDEIFAQFTYTEDAWILKDGSVDLPEIPLVETRDIWTTPPPDPPDVPELSYEFGSVILTTTATARATGYDIWKKVGAGAYALLDSVTVDAGDGLDYEDTDVSVDVAYHYKVAATNTGGNSLFSNELSFTYSAPSAPTLSESSSSTNVHLTTPATAKATSYKIYRNKNGGGYSLLHTSTVSFGAALDYHDTDVADADDVAYKVKASNSAGDSGYSNEVTDTIVATPIDPLTTSPLIWIDAEPAGHTAGDSISSISDQSSHSNNITMNGQNCIYRTSPFKYFENQIPNGRFTLGTRITTGRHFIFVYRVRVGDEQTWQSGGGDNSALIADANMSLLPLQTPNDSHRMAELLYRENNPLGGTIDVGFLGAGAGYRVNGGPLVPPIPKTDPSWQPAGAWVNATLKTLGATKPYQFEIISFHTSANVAFDTLFNDFGIPSSAYNGDLAAFGAWSSPLSAGDEGAIVAFLKARYSITNAPEEHIYIGDSLTYGAGLVSSNGKDNLINQVQTDNHANGLLSGAINFGIGSAPLGNNSNADLWYMYHNFWKTMRNPKASKQIIVLWVGANDIPQGASASTLYTNIQGFCAEAHADGFKILAISVAPSQFAPGGSPVYDLTNYATQRNAFNALMDSDHSFVDGWLNYSANTFIGTDSAPPTGGSSNTYFADGIHLAQPGYAILAPLVGAALRAIP